MTHTVMSDISCRCGSLQGLMCVVWPAVSAQYIQSMLLQRGSKTALLPLPVDVGLTAAAKLGSCMLEFAVVLTGLRQVPAVAWQYLCRFSTFVSCSVL